MKGVLNFISSSEAWEFLKTKHYAGRKPQISKAFSWVIDGKTVAVCTFGKPASNSLCNGVCGIENSSYVYELNRLCRISDLKEQLSQFVSACLRRLKNEKNYIIVSYSDTGMNHNGYIYQACNFIYTGCTKERTDKYTEGNKHSRHYDDNNNHLRKIRTAKHRYIIFLTKDKRIKKNWSEKLSYPICQFPKGENKNYNLGEFQKVEIIERKGKI